MTYIVLDLEFNSPFHEKIIWDVPKEIIEIGAVKLDDNLNQLDTYTSLVQPTIYTQLNPSVVNVTKMSINYFWKAKKFETVIKDFIKWIDGACIFCVWSNNDIPALIDNCTYHNINIDWIQDFIDIQLYYTNEHKRLISLSQALDLLRIKPIGNPHRALTDALNTCEIVKSINIIELIKYISNPKIITKERIKDINDNRINKRKLTRKCPTCGRFTKISAWYCYRNIFYSNGFCTGCNHKIRFSIKISVQYNGDVLYHSRKLILTSV